ncbi:MAG: hypothetical protein KDB94_10505 [Acidobacteria bacterium]|nr:hypothetical protein [Acidobacteriota bacterium]
MSRPVRLTLLSLALFLAIFPLTLGKPGLPTTIKADEAAYYLMARSLVEDGDLRCETQDIARLAEEFPYQAVENLILMTDDGWRTVYFGKPYLYSFLAAPLAGLFKANGLVAFNMLLLLASVGLGALYLARHNGEGLALLFSAGFFLLSNAFAYVWWMHPEILNLFGITACLYLAFAPPPTGFVGGGRWARLGALVWNERTRPFFSGFALALAAYNKPPFVLAGLGAFVLFFRSRGLRGALTWCSGVAVGGLLFAGIAVAFTGHPSAYLGVERAGFKIEEFDKLPVEPRIAAAPDAAAETTAASGESADVAAGGGDSAPAAAADEGPKNSWWWIFRPPEIDHRTLGNLGFFLVGRHTGLLLYAPFVTLCLLLFLVFARRSPERWATLAGLFGVAFFSLLWIPFNWHGGGGFVGNRYFVSALPGFLFLVTRIAPPWIAAVGYALGGLFVGPILFTPFGAPVPQPTLQAHVRNAPFRFFPIEYRLGRQIPGYRGQVASGAYFWGRRDVFLPRRDEMWVQGGKPVEIWVSSGEPMIRPVFRVETETAPNEVVLRLGDAKKVLRFDSRTPPGNTTEVTLDPSVPAPTLPERREDRPYYRYKMSVAAERFAAKSYRQAATPDEESGFLVGAIVTYLGTEGDLARDLFHVEWVRGDVPRTMTAGAAVEIRGEVRNASPFGWPAKGPTRVALAYHWLDADGAPIVWETDRASLPANVPAGSTFEATLEVEAPAEPGRYLLELDLVRERVAWFSHRNPGSTLRVPVDVLAADPAR